MPSHLHSPSSVPAALDYEMCTTVDLCTFFEERTGTTLSKGQLRKIQTHGNHPLINRLCELDRKRTFPRFMELPPELRLGVYEALLVEDEMLERAMTSAIHLAILRTSSQIYSEAKPVLYKQNKFRATIVYSESEQEPLQPRPVAGCSLKIIRPGGKFTFHERLPRRPNKNSLLHPFLEYRSMGMLQLLTHFTIDLDLVTTGIQDNNGYLCHASNAITSLCLWFTGPSKLKELTVKVKTRGPRTTNIDVAFVLWPLLFLRTNVVIKVEGTSTVSALELEQLLGYPVEFNYPGEEASFGKQIAQIRRLCGAEAEKCGLEYRGRHFDRVRDVEIAMDGLNSMGVYLIRLEDILNDSGVWQRARYEAARVEASVGDWRPWRLE